MNDKENVTESSSFYQNLEKMSVTDLLKNINKEDLTIPQIIEKAIPQIEILVNLITEKMKIGGRLFYIGAGTSGRLGILDASECPPTFGVDHNKIIGIIAGGDTAIRKAIEFAEDDIKQAWKDLSEYNICEKDIVLGITASGRTPYVIGGIKTCNQQKILTACLTCNPNSDLAKISKYVIEIIVGPEFLTGSTRMKAGTAQKLVLNMISTAVMIQLGHVKGNKMIDMQLSNEKLVDRAIKMIIDELSIDYALSKKLLKKHGTIRNVLKNYSK